jgi:hypothetical protein
VLFYPQQQRAALLQMQVNNQTLAGLGVLLRLRGPDVITEDAQLLVAAGSKRGPIGGFVCNVFPTTCLFIKELGASILANSECSDNAGEMTAAGCSPDAVTQLKESMVWWLAADVCANQRWCSCRWHFN